MLAYEENLEAKDVEIALLKAQLLVATTSSSSETSVMPARRVEQDGLIGPVSTGGKSDGPVVSSHNLMSTPAILMPTTRKGKAPH